MNFNSKWIWIYGLNPICHPSPAQKNEMLIFGLHSTSDDGPGWLMDSYPICQLSPAKKMKCSIFDYVQLLMIGRAGWWTQTPTATPLQPEKWNACFWIIFTSDDWLGWSMDLNPIHHPSPTKKMKCSFLDYIQLLMISWADWWTRTPSATPLQPKKMKCSLLDDIQLLISLGWSMDLNPIYHPSPAKKMKCSFLDYIQLLMIGRTGGWTQIPSATPHQPKKNEMLIFGLHSTSDDRPGWLMDSNPIRHPSPARKMKCLFLDYIHFWWLAGLVNGLEPHPPTILQPKRWNACFWITFNFWWSAGLINGLEPHRLPLSNQKIEMLIFGLHSNSDQPGWLMDLNPICHPSPAKKMKCSLLDYVQLLMIGWAARWTWTPSATPLQPKKWNAHFWITFNFWWLAALVDGLETPSATPLQPKKWNAHFWITFNFWWSAGLVDALEPHLPPLSCQKNKKLASLVKGLPICSSLWML